jgi:FAD/FMN-containing dehydrogenase
MPDDAGHAQRVAALRTQLHSVRDAAPLGLAKATSNLFRDRSEGRKRRLDLAGFCHVLAVDPAAQWVDTEGLVGYDALVDATLPHGVMPAVVPQLKTITAAGAVAGVGIEATSFRHGLVHDTLLEADVLLAGGDIVTCSPERQHRDLFLGLPNSYGTLGYALRLKLRTQPVKPQVQVRHQRFASADAFFDAMAAACAGDADFVDGVVFDRETHVLSVAHFADDGPPPSDYGFERIYYRSIAERPTDVLTVHDYLWRWDTDWFWCSRAFGAQNPWVRRVWPRELLRSDVYWRLVALDRRTSLTARVDAALRRPPREQVVQDIEIPVDALPAFLDFFHREVGITPVWVCPLRQRDPGAVWPLYPLDPDLTYVNVGFWSTVAVPPGVDPADGRVNRRIEAVVRDLGGHKSLYSTAFYSREEFAGLYGGTEYERLRAEYDPAGRLAGMWEKTVGRA